MNVIMNFYVHKAANSVQTLVNRGELGLLLILSGVLADWSRNELEEARVVLEEFRTGRTSQ